jgi:hypothetical protein
MTVTTSFPPLPSGLLSIRDVQAYVRLWPEKHILATKQADDGLLECVVYWKLPGHPPKVFQATRPADEGHTWLLRLGDRVYQLPPPLARVHEYWLQFPGTVCSRENWIRHVENIEALKSLEEG